MTGGTVGVGIVVIALLWSGAISASGPQTWQSLFGLICPRPAWSWSWRRCSASTSTAAEHTIAALRLDQRRHLRLVQPDSRSAPGYLESSILATGRWFIIGEVDRMRRPQGDLARRPGGTQSPWKINRAPRLRTGEPWRRGGQAWVGAPVPKGVGPMAAHDIAVLRSATLSCSWWTPAASAVTESRWPAGSA
jgi:hypothetical protein